MSITDDELAEWQRVCGSAQADDAARVDGMMFDAAARAAARAALPRLIATVRELREQQMAAAAEITTLRKALTLCQQALDPQDEALRGWRHDTRGPVVQITEKAASEALTHIADALSVTSTAAVERVRALERVAEPMRKLLNSILVGADLPDAYRIHLVGEMTAGGCRQLQAALTALDKPDNR